MLSVVLMAQKSTFSKVLRCERWVWQDVLSYGAWEQQFDTVCIDIPRCLRGTGSPSISVYNKQESTPFFFLLFAKVFGFINMPQSLGWSCTFAWWDSWGGCVLPGGCPWCGRVWHHIDGSCGCHESGGITSTEVEGGRNHGGLAIHPSTELITIGIIWSGLSMIKQGQTGKPWKNKGFFWCVLGPCWPKTRRSAPHESGIGRPFVTVC